MAFFYYFTPRSLRLFKKLPKPIQQRVIAKLDYYCQSNPLSYSSRLENNQFGHYRLRIGNYRVIYDLENQQALIIHKVGHRRDIYR